MSSCNLLAPNATVTTLKSPDTLSEVSESSTTNSAWTADWDSREDLRNFVVRIGLNDVSDLYQDRFRVDRKKLEQMLNGGSDAPLPADIFFEQIMSDTDTYITWPSKLKVGAKSRKGKKYPAEPRVVIYENISDPHVRIAGRQENVQSAKERIVTVLDTRCNRVTMKMDVSYTHHSHIIGKGGLSVKRVMEETKCHVHFPDSNRLNATEKSNQVSISGDIEGVESARSRVRALIPLIFGFELPILSQDVDATSPYVANIQEQFKVQVMFKTQPKLHPSLVLVKGVEWEVEQVKKATLLLMDYMCEQLASQLPVYMTMEISPHHHQIVLGKNHSNLKAIMRYTNCQIIFPDAQDPNIPSLKKSNISISGNIHNVYKARQLLMGSLPLIVIFDLPEDNALVKVKPEQIAEIQTKCDLIINIRHKAKQSTNTCMIKGIERHATNIYRARNLILGIEHLPITADIPLSYHFPPLSPSSMPVMDMNNAQIPAPQIAFSQPLSPLLSPLVTPTWQYPANPFGQKQGLLQPPMMYNVFHGSLSSSGYQSLGQGSANSFSLDQSRDSHSTYSSISSTSSGTIPLESPLNSSPKYHKNYELSSEKLPLSSLLTEMSMAGGYHGPTVDKQQEKSCLTPSDYEQKRIVGVRAMQNHPNGGYRIPNNSWSGYGISHTSPANCFNVSPQSDDELWKSVSSNAPSASALNTSNYADYTSTNVINHLTNMKWPDLPTLLTNFGLEKYIGRFRSHEIDLSTFASLTDQDLLEIGISAFGARRKMQLIISELNKRTGHFSAAPGAERKSMSLNTSGKDNW